MMIKIGSKVSVTGFKLGNPGSDYQTTENERLYILGFEGKEGIIEFFDRDELYKNMVFFGEDAKIRRCRFSDSEIQLV